MIPVIVRAICILGLASFLAIAIPAPDAFAQGETGEAEKGNAKSTESVAITVAVEDEAPAAGTVDVFYFHRTFRCHTCLTIEALAEEALTEGFEVALAEERLSWHPLNLEEPENAHYESDFELEANALIVACVEGGEVVAWQNLERVWDFFDDPPKFHEYVRENVEAALNGVRENPEER